MLNNIFVNVKHQTETHKSCLWMLSNVLDSIKKVKHQAPTSSMLSNIKHSLWMLSNI